MNSVNTNP